MEHDPRALLEDVDSAAGKIGEYLEGIDFDAYEADGRTQDAVERQFLIIGEALNRLHRTNSELAGKIPDLREIVGFRNVLAHGYFSIEAR